MELCTKRLEEKFNEVDQLKREVSKFNTDRAMWLSKQPQDVTTLMAEKQELRKQLDREQSEKQELFMQINSMIAKLADGGDQNEIIQLKSDVSLLKRELEAEKQSSNSESARLMSELQKAKSEIQNAVKFGDDEKEAMIQEIDYLKQQLSIKTASLQSLMLAKSDNTKSEKLAEMNDSMKLQLEALQKQVNDLKKEGNEKTIEIMKMQDTISLAAVARENMDSLEVKITDINRSLIEEQSQKSQLHAQAETLKNALHTSEETLSKLKVKLAQFEESALVLKNENEKLKQNQREATISDSCRIKELTQALSDERDNIAILNVQLREKDGKIDRTQVELLAAESLAHQAEEEIKVLRERLLKSDDIKDSNQQLQLSQAEFSRMEDKIQSVQKDLIISERTVEKKEIEFGKINSALSESEQQLEKYKKLCDQLREEGKQEVILLKFQVSHLELELQSQKKMLESDSKAAVADEISTLMSSLNSVREENNQYEDNIRGLQKDIRGLRDELYQYQDQCSQWKSRTEQAEFELANHNQNFLHIEESRAVETQRLESEKVALEKAVEEALKDKDRTERNATESIAEVKREMTETCINSDRQIQDLKEKVNSLTLELDSSRRRTEHIHEEQSKFIGSHEEVKLKLMKQLESAQQEVEEIKPKLEQQKVKNKELEMSLIGSETTSKDLLCQVENFQKQIEDLKAQLHAAEDLADRLQEAQILSGNVESKFTDLQAENKVKMDKMKEDYKAEIDILKEELKKSHTEHTSLENVLEEQQKELIRQRQENDQLSEELQNGNQNFELEQMEKDKHVLEVTIKKLESENAEKQRTIEELEKKVCKLSEKNEKLAIEVHNISKSLDSSSAKLIGAENEKRKAEEEVQQLKSSVSSEEVEMKEITAENARLAGELLRFHVSADKTLQEERERISKQFEERLTTSNLEKTRLASELQMNDAKRISLQKQVDELQVSLENAEKRRRVDIQHLDNLREELHQIKNNNEKLKNNTPIAPPRPSTRTISNMSSMTNWTQADFSDCEDLTRLRSEIDKQKRLIIVLRRKLQGLQQQ
ncbi:unnamed protein product [Caenorhabditis sp. 36 PRJEB53466]|nr:unnamed protein product [Caenorhabditis sp. 36 PRJEB53466]